MRKETPSYTCQKLKAHQPKSQTAVDLSVASVIRIGKKSFAASRITRRLSEEVNAQI